MCGTIKTGVIIILASGLLSFKSKIKKLGDMNSHQLCELRADSSDIEIVIVYF